MKSNYTNRKILTRGLPIKAHLPQMVAGVVGKRRENRRNYACFSPSICCNPSPVGQTKARFCFTPLRRTPHHQSDVLMWPDEEAMATGREL